MTFLSGRLVQLLAIIVVVVLLALALSRGRTPFGTERSGSTSVGTTAPTSTPVRTIPPWSSLDPLRGVTVGGADFGAGENIGRGSGDAFSNAAPGDHWRRRDGGDYRYPLADTYEYLAGRGVELVRVTFRWERIQPRRGAPLDPLELERLRQTIRQADHHGLWVVPAMMNYGAYWGERDGVGVRQAIGSPDVPVSDYVDAWVRLADALGDLDNVAAFGLMNEPVEVPGGAAAWEDATRQVVEAMREQGVTTTIAVPTYFWSNAHRVTAEHPEGPWIAEELGPVRYEIHQYWSVARSGAYLSYDDELELADAEGWATREGTDAVTARALVELDAAVRWLDGEDGWIGEVGWPNDADVDRWNAVADRWFDAADEAGLWVTTWTTGSFWRNDYHLLTYRSATGSTGAIDEPTPVARVLEDHL